MTAVVFDMDGVLVDSELHWIQVESKFLRELIPEWDDFAQESIKGMSAFDVHALLACDYGLSISHAEFIGYYQSLAAQIYGEQSSMIPGALDLLRRVSSQNLPTALASSSPHAWINIVVERFELEPFFQAVVSSDDVGGKGKPAPDIYLYASRLLGVNPAACLAVEDSAKGVRSAKAAGMKCIGFRNGFNERQDLTEADAVVDDFAALTVEEMLLLAK
jgi:HAD superfamily hydrolase (TIGR01509 family)